MSVKPVFNTGLPPNGPSQMGQVADFAEQGWHFREDTTANRTALSTAEKAALPIWMDSDTGNLVWYNGTTWLKLARALAVKSYSYPRVSSSASDSFAAGGGFGALISGIWAGAPVGEYWVTVNLAMQGSVVSGGNLRLTANGANLSTDIAAGVSTVPQVISVTKRYSHAGGDVTFSVGYQLSGGTATIWRDGSSIEVALIG